MTIDQDHEAAAAAALDGLVDVGFDGPPPPVPAAFEEAVRNHVATRARAEHDRFDDKVTVALAAVVRPGDTLVVTAPASMTAENAAAIKARLLEKLPELADVVVLSAIHVTAVYRPGEQP